MKTNSILRLCACTALVASAFGAQAAIMNLTGYKFDANPDAAGKQAVNVSVTYPAFSPVGAGTYGGGAGGFTGTLRDAGQSSLPTGTFNIDTYCVQLGEYFSPGTSYNYEVISPAASYFTPQGDDRTDRLAKLFSYVYATGGSNPFDLATTWLGKATVSAAVQLAVWEIKYETSLSGLDVTAGAFNSNGNLTGVYAQANQLLNASLGSDVRVELYVLRSIGTPGQQDQVFWRPKSVPEPGSVTLAMLAFAAAGVATTRRRAKA